MNIHTAVFELSAGVFSQLPEPDLPEVAFAGRSNVGKSSLINAIVGRKSLARTSSTPGKTATINFYRLDTLRLVDLPGYGYAKVAAGEKQRWNQMIQQYFDANRCRLVFQLIDMRHPPTEDDHLMMEYLTAMKIPFVVVLTKADKLKKSQRADRLAALEQELAPYPGLKVIPFSAVTREGVEDIREMLENI